MGRNEDTMRRLKRYQHFRFRQNFLKWYEKLILCRKKGLGSTEDFIWGCSIRKYKSIENFQYMVNYEIVTYNKSYTFNTVWLNIILFKFLNLKSS